MLSVCMYGIMDGCQISSTSKGKPSLSNEGSGGAQVVLWSACFFHIDMSIKFDLDVNMHVDIIRVSKSNETLAEKR